MSQQVVTELVIDSNTAGAADFERAMSSAEQAARRGTDAADNFTINLVALGAGAIAAAAVVKTMIDHVVNANKELADMAALADRVGLSLKDLQGIKFGGAIAGLTDGQINAGLEKSAELLNDAQRNANSLSKEFEANDLSIRKANGQLISENQLLQIAADLVSRARNPQDAIAIAQMLGFTKEWVPLLVQSSGAMKALGDEATKAGAVIDDETIQRATDFDRQWRKSSVEFSSYMKSALLGLLPMVDDLIERAARFVKSFDRGAIEKAAKDQLQALADPVGLPDEGGLKIAITPEAAEAVRDIANATSLWEGFVKTLNLFAANKPIGSVSSVAPGDLKWYNGTGTSISDTSGVQDTVRWQGQADSWKTLSAKFLDGADVISSGFSKVASRGNEANDAVDRAINTLRRHTEQQLAESAAIGHGVGVMAAFRAQAAETAAVQANQGKETVAQAAAFAKLKLAAADAAIALERAKVAENIRFGQNTGFLSQADVAIAQQLKGIYPDVAEALGSVEAKAIRLNGTFREMSSAIENNLTTGLTDIVTGTKSVSKGFADMGLAIVKAIDQAIIKILIVEPLMRALQQSISGSGILNFLTPIGSTGGGAVSTGAAGVGGIGGLYHSGGIVGAEPTSTRYVHPAYFDHAPKFHGGGIAGDEVPIIARRGEGVFTQGQMAAMGTGNGPQITFNVIEDSSRAGQREQTQSGNGGIEITQFVDAITAKNAGNPGSATSRVLDTRNRVARR